MDCAPEEAGGAYILELLRDKNADSILIKSVLSQVMCVPERFCVYIVLFCRVYVHVIILQKRAESSELSTKNSISDTPASRNF